MGTAVCCLLLLLLLLLPGERIMKLAEELYQAGFISYPRTETDVYDPGMDLRVSRSQTGQCGGWGVGNQTRTHQA